MEHVIRAQFEPDKKTIKWWHMVREGEATAMCGRELEKDVPEMASTEWGGSKPHPFCHTCGALYLREVHH
ncbi:hypothetical protein ACWCP6_21090 [Streptomyces sp. NPDC002004]